MTGQGTQECPLKQVGDEVVAGGQEEVARFLIFTPPPPTTGHFSSEWAPEALPSIHQVEHGKAF